MNIYELLSQLGFPVYRQGSMTEDEEYPATFLTFWNFETPEDKHHDNQATRAVWGYWVYCYSDDYPTMINTLEAARQLLMKAGWISTDGRGQDVRSDVDTHTGRMITVHYVERYKKERK